MTDDTLVLRALLEGLNAQARQWSEIICVLDNGSLKDLEQEVEQYRYLEHRYTNKLNHPNIVIAFLDRLRHSRSTENWIKEARRRGIPVFIISTYENRPTALD